MRLTLLAFLFSVPVLAADPPSVLWSRFDPTPRPVFIAATSMVMADGAPSAIVPEDWRVQQQRFGAMVSQLAARRPTEASAPSVHTTTMPCRGVMMNESALEPLVDRHTRHDAITNARAIVAGTIISVTPGFFYGSPGSLIELSSLEKLKLDRSYSAVHDTVYLRLPYAHFVSGGTEYCRESHPGYYVPHAGDKLLVFAYEPPSDATGTFIYSTSSDVITQSAGETPARVPKSMPFFDSPTAAISSIVSAIRSTLSDDRRIVGPRDGGLNEIRAVLRNGSRSLGVSGLCSILQPIRTQRPDGQLHQLQCRTGCGGRDTDGD